METQDYFTVKELAKYSRIGINTLYKAIQTNELRHVSIGPKAIVRKADFDSWFDSKAMPKANLTPTSLPKKSSRFYGA